MSLISRIIVILVALIVAVLVAMFAAGSTIAVNFVMPDWFATDADPIEQARFFMYAFIVTSFGNVLLAALVLIALAEAFRIRTFVYYGVVGGLAALLGYYTGDISARLENTTDIAPVSYGLQLVAAAGIIGGLVYWLIAGRKAGLWRDQGPTL